MLDVLSAEIGNWVALFRVEAVLHGGRHVECRMSSEAFLVKMPADQRRDALTAQILQRGVQVPANNARVERDLVCASLLRALTSQAHFPALRPIDTWQVCCCFVDVPTSSPLTMDGSRV